MEETVQRAREGELQAITVMKSAMMLLVVIYHCAALWMPAGWFNQAPMVKSRSLGLVAEYLNYIHIYAFTFASGYLFHYSNYIKRKNPAYGTVLKRRFQRLVIPYLVVSIFWVIPFEIAFFRPDIKALLYSYGLGTAPRQLWFLLMLFGVTLMFIGLQKLLEHVQKQVPFWAGMAFLYFLSIAAAVLTRLGIPNVFQFLTSLRYLLFFYFGYYCSENGVPARLKDWEAAIALFHIASFCCIHYLNNEMDGIWRHASIALTPLFSMTGVILSFRIAERISQSKFRNTCGMRLGWIRRDEFGIYLFHQQIIWIVISVLNSTMINPLLIFAASFVVSMIVSVLMTERMRRSATMRRLLGLS